MRVRNEEKYLANALASLEPLGGPVVLLDDRSTDSTASIANSFDNVLYHRQDDVVMDEGRDRTFIMREALKLKPRWIFTLDGDEELGKETPGRMLRAMQNDKGVNAFGMWLAVMAGDKRYYAGKFVWEMDRLFNADDIADKSYEFTGQGDGNLHCGCVPDLNNYKREKMNAFIKYWGYEDEEATENHLKFYEEHDHVNFGRVAQLNRDRVKNGGRGLWKESLCANDIGKRSVNY